MSSVNFNNASTAIGDYAFYRCTGLTSLDTGNGVTSIGMHAFEGSNLTSVIIGNSVTSIGFQAFNTSLSLETVIIGNSVTTIGSEAFLSCLELKSVIIGSAVTSIANRAFNNCQKLNSITSLATTPPSLGTNVFQFIPSTCTLLVPCGSLNVYSTAAGWSSFNPITTVTTPPPTCNLQQLYTGNGTIGNLQATGTGLLWYSTASGGSPLPLNTSLINGTTYFVSQKLNNCESTRTPVEVVKISEGTQRLCSSATVGNLISTPSTGASASWFANASGGSALLSTTVLNTATFYVEQNNPTTTATVASGFNGPLGVAVQTDGKILFVDFGNNAIKRMNADGTGIVTLGGGFNQPSDIAIQIDGKIVIADSGNNSIKRMNADGTGIVTLGNGFNLPTNIAIQSDGKIIVSDRGNSTLKRMNVDGSGIVVLKTNLIFGAVAIQDDGKIVVADLGNNTIKRINADGSGIVNLASGFNFPSGVAIQEDGKIVISDRSNNAIKRMNADGTNITSLGSGFNNPFGVAIQNDGQIIVADLSNSAIKRIKEAFKSTRVGVNVIISTTAAPTGNANQTFCTTGLISNLNVSGSNIKWYDQSSGGNVLPNSTVLVNNATYYATQTLNGCESSSRLAVKVTFENCLNTNSANQQNFSLFPNPTRGLITIKNDKKIKNFTLLSPTGQILLNFKNDDLEVKIDLGKFPSGTYLVKITTENEELIKKVIKL